MRVSNSMLTRISNAALMKRQEDIAAVQSEIASGKRIQKPSDDPIGSAQKVDHETTIAQINQYNRNIKIGQSRLESAEIALTSITEALQRSRELALTAANGTYSSNEHRAMASELSQIHNTIIAIGNTKDSSGNYLFSGTAIGTQPFTGTSDVSYNGNSDSRYIQARNNLLIDTSFSGDDVFFNIPVSADSHMVTANPQNTGSLVIHLKNQDLVSEPKPYTIEFPSDNTYRITNTSDNSIQVAETTIPVSGEIEFSNIQISLDGRAAAGDSFKFEPTQVQDVFTTIKTISDTLNNSEDSSSGKAKIRQNVNETLTALDATLDSLNKQRALVGTRLQSIDTIKHENEFTTFQLKETLSTIKDTNLTDAISRLQEHTLALQVLQQTTVRTQSLSLFNIT